MILPVYCRKCGDGPFNTVMEGQKHQREKHPRQGLAARLEQISRDVAVLAAEVEQLEAELATVKKNNEWLRSDRDVACMDGCQRKHSS